VNDIQSVAPGAVQLPGASLFLYKPAEFPTKLDEKHDQRLAIILSTPFYLEQNGLSGYLLPTEHIS
jgi:hypothetical protein